MMSVVRRTKHTGHACSDQMYRPIRTKNSACLFLLEYLIFGERRCEWVTNLDPATQTLSIQPLVGHFDVIQIDFATCDNAANQLAIVGANASHALLQA